MANICNNTMYVESENRENLDSVIKWFDENIAANINNIEDNGDYLDISFDSKWTFPEELMQELFETIPNKSDIYITCLSVEYGNLYHALWVCDSEGWKEV